MLYAGMPVWRVGYERESVFPELEGVRVNGREITQRFVGYVLEFANTFQEAREKAVATIATRGGTRNVSCWNTEIYTGGPLDALTAKREYEKRIAA